MVLFSCNLPKSDQAAISTVSLTDETMQTAVDFDEGQKIITLTRSYETEINNATLMFDISAGASLEIDGTLVDNNQYTFDLTSSKTLLIKVIAEDGQTINEYTLKIVYIPNTEALIAGVSSLDPSVVVEFSNRTIQVNYDYNTTADVVGLSFEISQNATLSLDGEPQTNLSALNIPLLKEDFAVVEEDQTVVITAENGTIGEYILRLRYTPFLTFSTGDMNDHTQPGSYLWVGYAELQVDVQNAVIYAIALPKTASAPVDIGALKAATPLWQTYNLQKNKAQWMPILNLTPETEYNLYMGIEYEGGSQYKSDQSLSIATTLAESQDWGSIGRDVKAYLGQTIIIPGVIRTYATKNVSPYYTQETPTLSVISDGYGIFGSTVVNADVLGDETAFGSRPNTYFCLQIPTIVTSLEGTWRFSVDDYMPQFHVFELIILDN